MFPCYIARPDRTTSSAPETAPGGAAKPQAASLAVRRLRLRAATRPSHPCPAPPSGVSSLHKALLPRGDPAVSITADLPRSTERPTNLRHLVLAALLVITAINYVRRNAIGPAATTIEEKLGVTGPQLDLAAGAFFLAYTLMQVPSGWLAQALGRASDLVSLCRRLVAGPGRLRSRVGLPRTLYRPARNGRITGRHLPLRHAHSSGVVSGHAAGPGHGVAYQFHVLGECRR